MPKCDKINALSKKRVRRGTRIEGSTGHWIGRPILRSGIITV